MRYFHVVHKVDINPIVSPRESFVISPDHQSINGNAG